MTDGRKGSEHAGCKEQTGSEECKVEDRKASVRTNRARGTNGE